MDVNIIKWYIAELPVVQEGADYADLEKPGTILHLHWSKSTSRYERTYTYFGSAWSGSSVCSSIVHADSCLDSAHAFPLCQLNPASPGCIQRGEQQLLASTINSSVTIGFPNIKAILCTWSKRSKKGTCCQVQCFLTETLSWIDSFDSFDSCFRVVYGQTQILWAWVY